MPAALITGLLNHQGDVGRTRSHDRDPHVGGPAEVEGERVHPRDRRRQREGAQERTGGGEAVVHLDGGRGDERVDRERGQDAGAGAYQGGRGRRDVYHLRVGEIQGRADLVHGTVRGGRGGQGLVVAHVVMALIWRIFSRAASRASAPLRVSMPSGRSRRL